MRISSIILVTVLFAADILVAAPGRAQGNLSRFISVDLHNVPLIAALHEIEDKADVVIMFERNPLIEKERIDLTLSNRKASEILDSLIRNWNLKWSMKDNENIIRIEAASETRNFPKGARAKTFFDISAPPVTGVITDEEGNPLAGISVTVKGTKSGVTTDVDGRFSIDVQGPATLIISSVEYESQEYKVYGFQQNISVELKKKISSLLEVVVNKGYYSTKEALNTGNVSTVTAKDIEKQPVSNVLEALSGRVPGLFIAQSSGFSNTGIKILIQGKNSIANGVEPFYIIDGVPYSGQLLFNLNSVGGSGNDGSTGGNPLNYLNPSDIESVTVLKDADATAIYGSRAANGAIIIITKKGKPGQTRIDLRAQNGWGRVAHKIKLFNNAEYLQMRHEALKNDGITTPSPTDYDLNGTWDTTRHTDWQKELIGNAAKYQDYNVSVSGGNELTQYLIGGTYHKETTVFPVDFPDVKASAHFSITSASLNKKFHVQMTGNFMNDYNRLPGQDLTLMALTLAPVAPALYNADGSINWAPDADGNSSWLLSPGHPIANFENKYKGRANTLVSNLTMSYEILHDLNFRVTAGYTNRQSDEVQIHPLSAYAPEKRPYNTRIGTYNTSNTNSWIVEPQLNYKYVFGKNQWEALIGTTIQQSNSRGLTSLGLDYNSDAVIEDPVSAGSISAGPSIASSYRYNALFGRIGYTYSDKYLINLTGRRDGSSRFGSENRFENFGAIGLGWIFSKEDFIADATPVLSFGKLKFSYGTTGNDQIGDYRFLDLYFPYTTQVSYQGVSGLVPGGIPNPFLQWESTRKINAGIDLGFLKDRILLNANYFQNRSSNQLLPYSLPTIAGFSSVLRNFPALIQNNGWELNINTVNIRTADFQWSTGINVTIPKNKLLEYKDLQSSSYRYSLRVGQPITTLRVYHLLGVDPTTGKYQFDDGHGQPTTTPNFTLDTNPLVNTAATLYGGFQNSFTYKGFSLDFLFQFMRRRQRDSYAMGYTPGFVTNQPEYMLNAWHQEGDIAPYQRFNSDFSLRSLYLTASTTTDAAYRDASFIRLKNLSLSYTLPRAWCDKMRLINTRIFVQGQNLLTITSYKGLDPESTGTVMPPLRVITFGLQVGL